MKNLYWLGVAALLILSVVCVNAQVAGRLSGSVTDPTGAVIPGATVNVYVPGGKEPVLTGKTNEAGLFLFIAVRPETYDVAVEAAGFAKTTLRSVKIAPVQETSLGAIRVEVLTANQSVEVSADTQNVQLSNAEVTSTITNSMVQNLPVLGRQVTNLFLTQPGVTSGSNTTSVNGLRSSFSNVTLDGINIQDNFIRTNGLDYAPMRTTIDQVAEITISTSNQNAAIGGGASQFILSTKSGTNSFHGSVYWYNRNSALAANDWFNVRDGVDKTSLNLNQPGAALGGRILRDKLFFYVNYEKFRDKETSSRTRTVLTDSAKSGLFTYTDSSGNKQQVNLLTARNFAINPTIKAMLDQLPGPNSTGGDSLNTSGYRFNARDNEYRDQFVYKGDYYITPKHVISGTYNYIENPTDRPDLGAFYTKTPPVSNTIRNHVVSLAWRWMISPTLTNEFRGGFARTMGNFDVSNDYPAQIVSGLLFSNPVNTYMAQGRKTNNYPIQDNATWVKGRHQIAFGFQSQLINSTPFNDAGIIPTYTLGISGNNTTGLTSADLPGIRSADLTRANNLYANLAGIISTAAQTFNVTSATSGFVPGATQKRQISFSTYAGYIQDNWKALPNLTFNLGLRYEYWTPLDEKNGLFLAPVLENNDVKATILDPNAVLDFIGGPSGRKFYKADKNNFAPNVGFAWDPFKDGKTSIRGGYMMAYVNDNVMTTVRNNVNTSNGLQFGNTMSGLVATLASPPTVTAPAYKVPRTLADNYAISTTSATGLPDPNLQTPYVHQWNIGIQREIKGILVAGRYVGNKGSDLLRAIDYNQILYDANGFLADFRRAQSNASLSEAAGKGYVGTYNASIAGSQQLTVFPLLVNGGGLSTSTNATYLRNGQIGELANQYMVLRQNGSVNFYTNPKIQGGNTVTNGGSSIYHSFQLEVTKRMTSSLQMQFGYVFGKSLSNTSGDGQTGFEPLLDNNNPSLEWARSPYDLRHTLKANFYYELPYGKGKRWSGNAVMNAVLGGWAISGIWSYQSGAPYSILSTYGTLNRDARSASTNTASVYGTTMSQLNSLTSGIWKNPADGTVTFVSPTLISSDGRGTSQPGTPAFSGQVFYNPVAGAVGNLQRRMFSGPWDWSWDMSVKKGFRIREGHTLDLHFDFFNFMNHPTFYVYPATAGDYGYTGYMNINSSAFGQVDSMNHSPRIIQIGAYYRF